MRFTMEFSGNTEDSPAGFLFLCPGNEFQIGPSLFRWPDCPAYWSFDPSGVNRLSAEEATQHGFPSIQLNTAIDGWYWDPTVYAGLRQFHRAKGFAPDSQDVARHLRNRLYQLSSPPFAHGKSTNLKNSFYSLIIRQVDSCAEYDQNPANKAGKFAVTWLFIVG